MEKIKNEFKDQFMQFAYEDLVRAGMDRKKARQVVRDSFNDYDSGGLI